MQGESREEFELDRFGSTGTSLAQLPTYPPHGCGPLGTVVCKGCGNRVDVVYPYSNSKRSIGIVDHKYPAAQKLGWRDRCADAGRSLVNDGHWLAGSGYRPEEVTFSVPLVDVPGAAE